MNSNCFRCKHIKTACGEYFCSLDIEELCPYCGRPMYPDSEECKHFEADD